MNPALIVLIVIAVVLVVAFIVLTILGKKAQKRKEEQDEQIAAASQTVNMLIIDKKRMKLKDAGLPQQIIEQTPKLMRRSKLPVVKAKVGPRVMSLIADEQIFDEIPLKKEVKASVSGISARVSSIFSCHRIVSFPCGQHFGTANRFWRDLHGRNKCRRPV